MSGGPWSDQIRSITQSCLTLRPHESQHARPPCPSPTPRVHWDSRPLSQWCHPAISSSVVPFSSCPQSLPASESFPTSQLFAWGGQSTGVSGPWWVSPICLWLLVLDLGGKMDICCFHGRNLRSFPISIDATLSQVHDERRMHHWTGTREKGQWQKAKFTLLHMWRNTGPPNVMEDKENKDKDVRVLSFLTWKDAHNISLKTILWNKEVSFHFFAKKKNVYGMNKYSYILKNKSIRSGVWGKPTLLLRACLWWQASQGQALQATVQCGLRSMDLTEQKYARGLREDHVALGKPGGEEGNLATTLYPLVKFLWYEQPGAREYGLEPMVCHGHPPLSAQDWAFARSLDNQCEVTTYSIRWRK